MAHLKILVLGALAGLTGIAAAANFGGPGDRVRAGFFSWGARTAPAAPGRIPGATAQDDAAAAVILGLPPGEWVRRLDEDQPRDRVHRAARALVRGLLTAAVADDDRRDRAFYPHLAANDARAAVGTLRAELHFSLGVKPADLRRIGEARAGRASTPLESTIDLGAYAAAAPRVARAIHSIEIMAAGPLTNEVRRQLRELHPDLLAAAHREVELNDRGGAGGLLRASSAADDLEAARQTDHASEAWTALMTAGDLAADAGDAISVGSRRGRTAALALVDALLAERATLTPGARAFYPRYVQHDDGLLRRRLREHVMKTLGLERHFYDRSAPGQTLTFAGLRRVTGAAGFVAIDLRLLRAMDRARTFAPSFLRNAVEDALFEVRAELVSTVDKLHPGGAHADNPAVRAAEHHHEFAIDDAFILRVMAFDDPHVRELLRSFWAGGGVRADPTFASRIPRRLRRDLLGRGYEAFAAFVEHELDEDVVLRDQAGRRDGRTHRLARARLNHLRDAFLAHVKAECARRLGGG